MVWLCLLPFRYPRREVLYIGWVGLRGAVPIVLATFPVLAGAPGAARLFDLVFFIVVVNAVVQGGSVAWLTRKLGLQSKEPPAPQAVLAIESRQPLQGELMSFYIDPALVVVGVPLEELPLPKDRPWRLSFAARSWCRPSRGPCSRPAITCTSSRRRKTGRSFS